jgi:3-methyladenine DNA glycosylase AlkD
MNNSILALLRRIIMADTLTELFQHTLKVFSENADASQSKPMSAYMRDQFPFLGIKAQKGANYKKRLLRRPAIQNRPFCEEFVRCLWGLPEREYQYFAVDYLIGKSKTLEQGPYQPSGRTYYIEILVGYCRCAREQCGRHTMHEVS